MMFASNLTPETVVDIFLEPGQYKAVARKFDLHEATVRDIKRRATHRKTTDLFTPEGMNGMLVALACVGKIQ